MINITNIPGVMLLNFESFTDNRGVTISAELTPTFLSAKLLTSYNSNIGTIRGLHMQTGEFSEEKIIWCTSGQVYDVVLDLRPDSPTFMEIGFTFLTQNQQILVLPKGVAHGYQTLSNSCSVNYLLSNRYHQSQAIYINPLCSILKIKWPELIGEISLNDKNGICIKDMSNTINGNNHVK